jgi:hypothetical protein
VFLLLIGAASLKQSFKITAAFAAGQSLTLILSGLQLLSLPERIISPLITLSLVFLALHMLFKREDGRLLPWIAAVLGLIHGCGYAEALSGLKPDAGYFTLSVLSFYTGAEIALVLIALILALAAAYLRRWSKALPVIQVAAALAGLLSFTLNTLL